MLPATCIQGVFLYRAIVWGRKERDQCKELWSTGKEEEGKTAFVFLIRNRAAASCKLWRVEVFFRDQMKVQLIREALFCFNATFPIRTLDFWFSSLVDTSANFSAYNRNAATSVLKQEDISNSYALLCIHCLHSKFSPPPPISGIFNTVIHLI